MNRSGPAVAVACLFAVLMHSPMMAQDTAHSVLEELTSRGGADVPILAECDFVCKYKNESWTVHSRSFRGLRTPAVGYPRVLAYGLKAEPMEGLNVLFPTGVFMGIASCLDPITLHWGIEEGALRLLAPVKLDGVECKVLELHTLPRQAHLGSVYPVPALVMATVSLFVHEGRIMRIVAQVMRKPTPNGAGTPLIVEATPRYRRAKTGAERQPGARPASQFTLNGNFAMVNDIAWSPDGKTIACMIFGGGCAMISASSGKELGTIPVVQNVGEVRFTPDGKYLVMPDQQEGRILYLHSATGKEAKSVPVGAYNIMVVSPDLSRAVVWDRHSSQNRPRMVEYFTGRTLCELPSVKSGTIQFSRDGKLFAVLQDGRVMIKDASTGRDLYSFVSNCGQEKESDSEHSLRMAFSPDSRLIAIGDASPGVSIYQLFDAEEHEPVRVYVYEVETGKLLQTLTGMNGAVRALQFSPDGSILAVGDSDDRGEAPGENAAVLLWETKRWKSLGAIAVQPQSAIAHMLFSPDGKLLATVGDRAPSVEVWPVPPLLSR